jgi:hypothetical protein
LSVRTIRSKSGSVRLHAHLNLRVSQKYLRDLRKWVKICPVKHPRYERNRVSRTSWGYVHSRKLRTHYWALWSRIGFHGTVLGRAKAHWPVPNGLGG